MALLLLSRSKCARSNGAGRLLWIFPKKIRGPGPTVLPRTRRRLLWTRKSGGPFPLYNITPGTRIPITSPVPCNLVNVKLPWQKSDNAAGAGSTPASALNVDAPRADEPVAKGYTPPKAKPTPKRREREIERGVIRDPNRTTVAKAGQRRKELKASMTKEEWKEFRRNERQESQQRNRAERERLDSGKVLLPRDQGEERAFVRNWVDSRRFFNNLFMPFALVMLVSFFISSMAPSVSEIITNVMLVAIVLFFLEGFITGVRVNRAVRERFPSTTESGLRLGFYAYSRTTQPRRWRTPRPQVDLGASA